MEKSTDFCCSTNYVTMILKTVNFRLFLLYIGRKARILVATAWGLSAIFSLPSIFLNSKEEVKGMPQCWIDLQPWQWQLYITLVAISLFFLPALIIAACYTVIVYTIWTNSRTMSYPKINKSASTVGDSKKSK